MRSHTRISHAPTAIESEEKSTKETHKRQQQQSKAKIDQKIPFRAILLPTASA